MKKTFTLAALLSLITVSAIAEETPMMTQTNNQAERQIMQTNSYQNNYGTQNGSGSQVQTRTRTQMQTMQMQGSQMQPQMQHNSRMSGGRSR